jgi:hypothetical protein
METETVLYETEINAETGETTVRELTTEEVAEVVATQAAYESEQNAKAKAKASALAKLKKLGLTAAEIEAL